MGTSMNRVAIGIVILLVGAMIGCSRPSPLPDGPRQIDLKVPETKGDEQSRRVLVVCNTGSEESIELTEYYATKRNIPRENIVQVRVTIAETIGKNSYRWDFEKIIRDHIRNSKNEIDFIVITKGIPIRVENTMGHSVDSLLAAMNFEGDPVKPGPELPPLEEIERMKNPFYNSDERFSAKKFGMFLVTRLDGYDLKQAKRMIDLGLMAKPLKGPFYFDLSFREGEASKELENDLAETGRALNLAGKLAWVEKTKEFKTPPEPVMGYVSWGSNDPAYNEARYRRIKFLPGALAETFVSTSARSFLPQIEGQSEIGDLIQQGVTGIKGYTSEPWTFALARPSILFDRYTRGWTLAESFYAASPVVRWKDIVVGDPLVAPYAE